MTSPWRSDGRDALPSTAFMNEWRAVLGLAAHKQPTHFTYARVVDVEVALGVLWSGLPLAGGADIRHCRHRQRHASPLLAGLLSGPDRS